MVVRSRRPHLAVPCRHERWVRCSAVLRTHASAKSGVICTCFATLVQIRDVIGLVNSVKLVLPHTGMRVRELRAAAATFQARRSSGCRGDAGAPGELIEHAWCTRWRAAGGAVIAPAGEFAQYRLVVVEAQRQRGEHLSRTPGRALFQACRNHAIRHGDLLAAESPHPALESGGQGLKSAAPACARRAPEEGPELAGGGAGAGLPYERQWGGGWFLPRRTCLFLCRGRARWPPACAASPSSGATVTSRRTTVWGGPTPSAPIASRPNGLADHTRRQVALRLETAPHLEHSWHHRHLSMGASRSSWSPHVPTPQAAARARRSCRQPGSGARSGARVPGRGARHARQPSTRPTRAECRERHAGGFAHRASRTRPPSALTNSRRESFRRGPHRRTASAPALCTSPPPRAIHRIQAVATGQRHDTRLRAPVVDSPRTRPCVPECCRRAHGAPPESSGRHRRS